MLIFFQPLEQLGHQQIEQPRIQLRQGQHLQARRNSQLHSPVAIMVRNYFYLFLKQVLDFLGLVLEALVVMELVLEALGALELVLMSWM